VRDTVGLYDPATAAFYLKNANEPGSADIVYVFGPASETGDVVPLVGDWDGDGTDSVGIYVRSTGTFFLKNANAPGDADAAFTFGPAGASLAPISGDWDGDGVDTVGLYDAATGVFYLRNANAPGAADLTFVFGAANASLRPLVGDWDNDGADSIAIYDSATGAIFLKNGNVAGPGDWTFTFGAGGLLAAVAANWDGI
jgi:hypothetical protein